MTQSGLRGDAALLAAIVESSDDAIVSKTLDGTVLSWNAGAERLYGYSAEEMIGRSIGVLLPPGQEAEMPMILEQIAAGERVDHYETARLTKDGRIVDVSLTVSPVIDESGAVAGASAMARDITARKEAERLEIESASRGIEGLYKLIIETAAEGIWAIDERGLTTFVNQKLPEMLGYSAEEMIGKNPCEFVAEQDRGRAVESFARLQAGARGQFEFTLERRDGVELHALVSGTPVYGAQGFTGGLAVVTDVTGRELTERRLAAQHAVTEALATSDTIVEATPKLLRAVGEAMDWGLAQVWYVRWSSRVLRFGEGWYADDLEDSAFARASRGLEVEPGEGVLGRVWERNEATWVTDLAEEPALVRAAAAETDGLRTLVAFPVSFRGRVRAVVEFASTTKREVDEPLLEMVEAARGQIAQFMARKQAELALREAEHRFRTLVENLPLATYVDRLDDTISNVYSSPQIEPMFGYTVDEWQSDPGLFMKILHPDDRERVVADHARLTEIAQGLQTEYRVFARDGSVVWVRDHAVVIEGDDRMRYIQGCLLDITERKRTEVELRESERRLAAAQRIAQLGSWEWDIGADRVVWSDEMKRIYGVSDEAFGGEYEDFINRVHPDDRQLAETVVRQAYETGEPFTFEHRLVRPDGEVRWIHAEGEVLAENGKPVRMTGTGQDVTDQKIAEARVIESEARFRAMYESAALGVVLIDTQRRILLTNHAFEEMVGYTKDKLLGMSFTDLTYPEDEPRSQQILSILGTGGMDLLEKRYIRKDGGLVWARVTSAPVMDAGGRLQSAIGIIENISERKLAEARLRERELQYETLIETARDAFVSIDDKSRIVGWNREAERLFGWSSEEAIGRRLIDTIMPSRYRRRHLKGLQTFVRTGREHVMDRTLELAAVDRHGTEFPIELTIWPTRHGESWRFNSFIRDLRERRTLQEQLVHSQKMEAVGKLAGGVAHDFNNLLLAIRGYSELALDDLANGGDGDGHLAQSLEQIKEATKRAASLTSKLLMFSRKQILNPRVVDLNELIAGVETLVRRVTGVDVELVISLDPSPCPIRVDPTQMEQAIMNIAINARDAMVDKGTLEIRTSHVTVEKDEPHDQAIVRAGEYVQLAISDTGTGMNEETRGQVFDPFFTTKELEKGTGLGLSTVYGFVKESKGFVFCESELGRGSLFTLLIPVAEGPASPPEDEETVRSPARGSETVLLAEDEDAVRHLLSVVLEREGYEVVAARDGDEALRLAAEAEGGIDVLVTDVVMPKLGGRALADRLAAENPGLQVIFMSGYTADPDALADLDDAHFLQKPFAPKLLAGRVREALDEASRPS